MTYCEVLSCNLAAKLRWTTTDISQGGRSAGRIWRLDQVVGLPPPGPWVSVYVSQVTSFRTTTHFWETRCFILDSIKCALRRLHIWSKSYFLDVYSLDFHTSFLETRLQKDTSLLMRNFEKKNFLRNTCQICEYFIYVIYFKYGTFNVVYFGVCSPQMLSYIDRGDSSGFHPTRGCSDKSTTVPGHIHGFIWLLRAKLKQYVYI
jgi:hypothetical protein